MPATATIPLISGRPLPRYADVLRSEFCKLRSVRSTFWALAAAVMFNVVVAALLAILLPGHLSAHEKATLDSVRASLGGLHLSQIAIGLLGTLAITSEYSTGMIRASLAAVPQRRVMLTAKMAVFTASVLVTGIIAAGAVAALFGLLFIPSLLAALLPASWQDTIGPYLPMNAGDTIYTVQHQVHTLQPWPGFGVFCLYAAAALAAGFVLISHRDA